MTESSTPVPADPYPVVPRSGSEVPHRHAVTSEGYVPMVDLGGIASDNDRWRAAADQVDAAARRSGFYLITGHDVPDDVIGAFYQQALEMFHLSPEEQANAAPTPADPMARGLADSTKVSASYGLETDEDAAKVWGMAPHGEPGWRTLPDGDVGAMLGMPNVYPSAMFRRTALAYYAAMAGQLHVLLALHADALGLPRHYFLPMHHESLAGLVANYYPRQKAAPDPERESYCMGPHTDWGTLTILWHSGQQGLQIVDPEQPDRWVEVPSLPRSLVVNVGDALGRMTGYRSALHRVECPVGDSAAERVSLVYFGQPGWADTIAPIPGYIPADADASRPLLYGPEFMLGKMRAKTGV
jgi:isopenicillin N synthase-like dioxygenase